MRIAMAAVLALMLSACDSDPTPIDAGPPDARVTTPDAGPPPEYVEDDRWHREVVVAEQPD